MSKLKQLVKSLLSDGMFVGTILGGFTGYSETFQFGLFFGLLNMHEKL
jgi:hypothetical protein